VEPADLISDPSREVDRIVRYLGVAPDDEQVRAAIRCVLPKKRQ